jgi:hypothetical protein
VRPPRSQFARLLCFLIVVAVGLWSLRNLIHAATTGEIDGNHGMVALAEEPGWFWRWVVVHSLSAVFGVGLLVLAILALVLNAFPGFRAWRRNTKRIDAYLNSRPEDRINPPPLRRPRSP